MKVEWDEGALAGLTTAQVPKLTLKWAFGFDGDISAFSQPTVIGTRFTSC